jgi:thiamine-phosphate pyrophosphorylase
MPSRCLLYYITDRSQFSGDERARRHALLAKVAEAARAVVDYIQLREKDLSSRELEMMGREVLDAVRDNVRDNIAEVRPRVLINSRTDVALAAGADSCHSKADVIRAESEGADFAVFAPVFGKNNAPGRQPTGLAALHEACRAKIPVLALGGVTMENTASCLTSWSGRRRRHPFVSGE